MPPKPTIPLSAENSVWPDIRSVLILPTGMTAAKAWKMHSMPNLLRDFDAKTCSVQLVPHRGIPECAKAVPDSSMEALRCATVGQKGNGGNVVELDPLWINGDPYIMHDLTEDRQMIVQGAWSQWTHPAGQQMPNYIQRGVKGAEFTERYVPTSFRITSLAECISNLLSYNSEATLFLDGRNEDSAKLVVFLSQNAAYRNNALVQLYPYTFRNGVEFVEAINELSPATPAIAWKRNVSIVPVLNPDTLPALAGVGRDSLDYTTLYAAGK